MPFLDSQSACGMRVARFLKAHSLFLVPSCDATLHLRLCSGAFDPRVPRPHSTASLCGGGGSSTCSLAMSSRGVLSSQRTSSPPAPGPLAAALQARAICHVMSQRRVMRTHARLGALSAAPCVCPRPLLYRLATPCRSRACIHVGPTPVLTMILSVRQRCLKNPLA